MKPLRVLPVALTVCLQLAWLLRPVAFAETLVTDNVDPGFTTMGT